MGDFYAYNIRLKRKEKLLDYGVGLMKIKGITKDTSRYFVRGKISDGSERYLFINEAKYKELKSKGIKDLGTIVKQRKEKKKRSRKSKSKGSKNLSKAGGRGRRSGGMQPRRHSRSRSRSRTGGRYRKKY